MDPYIGKFLDHRYELLEVIGSGGMAQVYRARCHRLNRLVAVKILRSDLAQDADFRRRFHDESQAVAMLSHPNIMSVYDVSRADDVEYIVMELIDGITLKQYMQKKGPLNWREALHFITQIMKGLSHAHSRGIIHRDIKPQNIMVLRDGSVKVTDFGIARVASSSQNTLTQEALGSVHYISPEQARGSRVDARSDVYSAGVVLYEMTTGRLPYEGDSAVSIAIQHINSMPLSPREINPEIPLGMEAIIMRAMAPSPDDRYATADDMLADLEELRKHPNATFRYAAPGAELWSEENEPTRVIPTVSPQEMPAAPEAAPEPERPPEREQSPPVHTPPVRTPPPRRTETEEPEEEPEKSGSRGFLIAAIVALGLFLIGVGYFLWVFFFSGMFAAKTDVVVPNLIGKTMEQVQADDKYDKFTIVVGSSVPSEEYGEGRIIQQDPEYGRRIKEGDTITVTLSAGAEEKEMVVIANVVGRTEEYARDVLEQQGFKIEKKEEPSASVREGYVISTDPKAGASAEAGSTVTVLISTGRQRALTTVPLFTGMQERAARRAIQNAGLTVGTVEEVDSSAEKGQVVWQSVPYGTEVAEGTAINLHISKGAAASPSPGVSPSAGPSAEPTQVLPTGTAQQPVSKPFQIKLPAGEGTVHVRILVNEEVAYDQVVDRTNIETIQPTLTGVGVCNVDVYFDGVLSASTTVDFSD